MTDTEKVLLCQTMIKDYWDYGGDDGAGVLIVTLSAVLDFDGHDE